MFQIGESNVMNFDVVNILVHRSMTEQNRQCGSSVNLKLPDTPEEHINDQL